MENQTETVKVTATETPAPVAETPAVASVTPTPTTAATAAGEKPQISTPSTDKPKAADFFRQREEKREKKATERVAELEKKIAELEISHAPAESALPPSLLDDPEKWAQGVEERALKRAESAWAEREARSRGETEYRQASESAANWLLTRSHLKEDAQLTEEVFRVIEEKYASVANVNPSAAVELAYIRVCQAKGIMPDMDGFKSSGFNGTGGNASSGAKPSAPAAGKRVFARGEGTRYINEATPGTPEYKQRINEIEEAHREGRIR